MTVRRWTTVGLLCVLLLLEVLLAFLVLRETDSANYGANFATAKATENTRIGADFQTGASLGRPMSVIPSPIPTPIRLQSPDPSATGAVILTVRPTTVPSPPNPTEGTPMPAPDPGPTAKADATEFGIAPMNGTPWPVSPGTGEEIAPTPGIMAQQTRPAPIVVDPIGAAALTLVPGPPLAPTAPLVTATMPASPPTIAPTATAGPTATIAPGPTASATYAPTPTAKPSPTPTPSPQPTSTPEPTATPRPTVAATPTPTPYPTNTGLMIECILYDGVVPRSEADEYVQIVNSGPAALELKGWKLKDLGSRGPEFIFESSYSIRSGQQIRVYTNQVHDRWGGFSFKRGSAIWSNENSDTAGLFDPSGRLVSQKSYPPGCGE